MINPRLDNIYNFTLSGFKEYQIFVKYHWELSI